MTRKPSKNPRSPSHTPDRQHPRRDPEPVDPVDYNEYDTQWPQVPTGED